ncbi:hypothetical protein JCM8202v2_003155 [Rhodotorula sphaerocarpa]
MQSQAGDTPATSTESSAAGPGAAEPARPLACLGNLPPELKALIVLKAAEVDFEAEDEDDEDDDEERGGAAGWVDVDEEEEEGEGEERGADAGRGEQSPARTSKRKREQGDVGHPGTDRKESADDDDDGWRDIDDPDADDDPAYGPGHEQFSRDMSDALRPTALGALSLELDFEYRSNESALRCIREILPKRGKHVRSIDFGQSDARMLDLEADGTGYQSADPFGHIPRSHRTIIEAAEELNKVSGEGLSSEIRHRRTRSLLMAEVIRQCPNIVSVDTELMPKTRPEWSEDLEERDLTNSDIIYATDHAIDAVKRHLGAQLEDLSLLINDDGVSTEGDLADILLACPNLLRLQIDCLAPSGPRANREKLHRAFAGLRKLESLTIDSGEFMNDEFATAVDVGWPLKVLALTECDDLSFPAFFAFVHRFAATLECLDVDRTPHDNHERETEAYVHRAVQLPRLDTLCLATVHEPAWLLEGFAHCPLREFSLGFCPAIGLPHLEQFIDAHAPTLKRIEVGGDAALTEAQVESLEVLCHSKHIECEVLPVETDDEDDEDDDEAYWDEMDQEDEDEDDPEAGWTDEDEDEDDVGS